MPNPKLKHISVKDLFVRVRKKNKTKGRPSKYEVMASEFLSYQLELNKKEIKKSIEDMLLYGTGVVYAKS